MTFNGKVSREIGNHPFLFLTGLGLVIILLLGGFLLVSGKGVPGLSRPTATATPTETATPTITPTATSTVPPTATPTPPPTAIPASLVVTFIDVNLGDAILIQAPEGQTALIDGGEANGKALAYLQEQGIKSIDVMVATMPLEDHVGGLAEVLDAMPVKTVITIPEGDTTSIYRHFLDAVATAGTQYVEVVSGDSIHLGSLEFKVLNPGVINPDNMNTNSLVLELTFGKTTFLFMGDANRDAEDAILASNLTLQADILKLGQHGSCDASDPAFLDAVHPTVAIYFNGLYYPFMNPCPGTISALEKDGILIYGTDKYGSISVTVTQDGYSINDSTGEIFRK